MNSIDGMRIRGTVAGRAGRAVAGTVLLAGAMFGLAAQPAYATPGPTGDLASASAPASLSSAVAVVTCGGLTEAAAQAAGYVTHNHAADATGTIDVGTPGPDWMVGSAFIDILDGQGGNDLICGRDGADDLRGLGGDDTIFGGNGNDQIDGGVGVDVGRGGNGINNVCTPATETQNNC